MAETAQIERRRIDPGIVSMVASGKSVSEIIRGVSQNDWFGPLQPLPPLAPKGTRPRRLDYPVGANLDFTPRADEAVGFAALRALADGYDLLRLVIETRKDQVSKEPWVIRLVGRKSTESAGDARVKSVTGMLRYPDGEHPWQAWLRALLEDMFVIDAASILPRLDSAGKIVALDVIDGATVKRLIDSQGRTPAPPSPAYQQIIKGLPAVDLSTQDLVYMPRNLRAHKVYGYSPVEQVLMTVNIALRRQISQLNFYTEGNLPEALVQVPETWTSDQISQFQRWFDSILTGNLARRRRMTFIPEAGKVEFPKTAALTDPFDEWLARVVCFAFSIPPTPFTKQTSRATARQAQQQALEEGLQPTLRWIAGVLNLIIQRHMELPEIEFAWQDEKDPDALKQAQIDALLVKNGIVSIDEVRAQRGYDPVGQGNAVVTATGIVPVGEGVHTEPEPARSAKLKKKTGGVAGAISRWLAEEGTAVGAALAAAFRPAHTEEEKERNEALVLALVARMKWEQLAAILTPRLVDAYAAAGGGDAAVRYAERRAGQMARPRAKWSIVDTTEDGILEIVEHAEAEGWPAERIASAVRDSYAFSDARAASIADTELAAAESAGEVAAWRQQGVEMVRWLTSPLHLVPDECDANVAAGAVVLGTRFPSGVRYPPSHPHCRCRLEAVAKEVGADAVQ